MDGHAEYWKWGDERTRDFAIKAMDLENPDVATGLRDENLGNEDIRKLVMAVWGSVGW
jgi:hypothetical protein